MAFLEGGTPSRVQYQLTVLTTTGVGGTGATIEVTFSEPSDPDSVDLRYDLTDRIMTLMKDYRDEILAHGYPDVTHAYVGASYFTELHVAYPPPQDPGPPQEP